mmetsp:Transcript_85050/g.253568  ORF Transcript_85050/g.253568 Transcript_85050/m.253568 type:complete len:200 (-) Transcript_85050:396-995(-)
MCLTEALGRASFRSPRDAGAEANEASCTRSVGTRASSTAMRSVCSRSMSWQHLTASRVPTISLFFASPRTRRRPVISSPTSRPPLPSASRMSKRLARSGGMSISSMSRCTLESWMMHRNISLETGSVISPTSSKEEALIALLTSWLVASPLVLIVNRCAATNFFRSCRVSCAMRTASRRLCFLLLLSPSVFAALSVFSM